MAKVLSSNQTPRIVRFPAHDYQYKEVKASNGFILHVVKTDPANVTLEAVRQNVTLSDYYGINGGFFYEQQLLSMAVVNGNPVAGENDSYGSGVENTKYPRGTLVWDGAANQLSVQIVSNASELQVTDRSKFWAQGGISMLLGRDEEWFAEAAKQHAPYMDDNRLRSAVVYDFAGEVYLIVSSTKGTLADFRAAILERVGEGRLSDGIFLDGDGSSQLQIAEALLPGDSRPVVQMIRIVR
ncbi:hypothetical protein [Paenibacillus montanisoli]|uniref:Phosphodiester glycosidase domain-containing protein n=1 Tax=Paenibacillus montanisoli TaxID=2081970 RepID=A0A328U077_9BACL|nr:hypothetical protein [Paenibacillus montanisoli]RAP76040.1 hypothetical protein DL346_11485 [Paenibacillus montanisoli]